jgi:hypothetical protein
VHKYQARSQGDAGGAQVSGQSQGDAGGAQVSGQSQGDVGGAQADIHWSFAECSKMSKPCHSKGALDTPILTEIQS